ncbi:MAG: hypothetical protein HYZ26_13795 [Chloroflexi bacterium]|nr:hypothetical protein [Chloroflexota bacterium]
MSFLQRWLDEAYPCMPCRLLARTKSLLVGALRLCDEGQAPFYLLDTLREPDQTANPTIYDKGNMLVNLNRFHSGTQALKGIEVGAYWPRQR